MNEQQRRAIELMRADPRRDLYEAADINNSSRGSGLYFVTYGNGRGPTLTQVDVESLLRANIIRKKWADSEAHMYVLTSTSKGKP